MRSPQRSERCALRATVGRELQCAALRAPPARRTFFRRSAGRTTPSPTRNIWSSAKSRQVWASHYEGLTQCQAEAWQLSRARGPAGNSRCIVLLSMAACVPQDEALEAERSKLVPGA